VAGPKRHSGTATDSGLLNLGFATFDAAGRVASVANGNGSNTRFTYDSNGNLATVLDAVGNMTQWVYNAEGQVTEEINALGDSRYYGYKAIKRDYAKKLGGGGQRT
jgi:YD repeat-containing protein